MRKNFLFIFFILQGLVILAQSETGIEGKTIDIKTLKPLQNVVVSVRNTNLTIFTNASGIFTIEGVPKGSQIVQVQSTGYKEQFLVVDIEPEKMLDLGIIFLEEDITVEKQLSLIAITDNDLGDDNSGSESTAGLMQATRDVFQQAAAYNWGQARFRVRGLDNEYGMTLLNGIEMNKIYDGRPQWSNWGGLNDVTRNQEFTTSTMPSDYTFGNLLGIQQISTRASLYRKGGRLSFSGANATYDWRAMATYASGLEAKGWAFAVSASRRWAQEGYFEGTDYDSGSLFMSVEKKFGDHHSLNFTGIYANSSRGKNSANTDEVTQLVGYNYNSYWGWQDGKKRNSRNKDVEEPIAMLNHYWKISDKSFWNSGISYQFGKIGNSKIGYQGADNPDPTYYKKLPSYYTSAYNPADYTDFWGDDPQYVANGLAAKENFLANPQLDWNQMYQVNNTSDGHSAYIVYEDRTDDRLWSVNSVFGSQLDDNISLNAGLAYRKLNSHNYQNMLDLLGGKFYVDYNPYQTGSEQESDLNHPNRKVGIGDAFGYNYNLFADIIEAFTQFKFTYRKIDFYLAQNYSQTKYQREGLYRNGLYPSNSYGKSRMYNYENFGFKGGFAYKISGRQFLVGNGLYMTNAPTLRNVFPNARINGNSIDAVDSESISSADFSYVVRTPKWRSRITAFYTSVKNTTETSFFFGDGIFEDVDGNGGDAFVVETVTGMNKQNIGLELGTEYQLSSTFKLLFAAAYGEYTYANNPTVYLSNDNMASETNTNPVVNLGESFLKGYRLANGPQKAVSFGAEYRDPKYWWIGTNINYLADNYIDVAALIRTNNFYRNPADLEGLPFPEATKERGTELLQQKELDSPVILNLIGGKSWRFGKKTFGFFASVNNVLDYTYRTGGFEQSRNANFRELNQDVSSGTPAFAPKYFYGYGRNYFVNFYFNF